MLHIVTSKNSSEHILHTVLFFLCNKHLLKTYLYRTKLTLLHSLYLTSLLTYHITVLIGLDTSTYFLLILTVTF